ncbi:hypothetical protein ACLHG3_004888 [Serratia marcescens]
MTSLWYKKLTEASNVTTISGMLNTEHKENSVS